MKKIIYLIMFFSLVIANSIDKCLEGNGLYIPDKGCLIEHRAICIEDNQNVTYGFVNKIPNFAKNYVEKSDFNISGIYYTAKITGNCRVMNDTEIKINSLIEIIKNGKIFKKDGFFIHYGKEPFDWMYVKNDGSLIAFLKPSKSGFLEYTVTTPQELGIKLKIYNTKIIIDME